MGDFGPARPIPIPIPRLKGESYATYSGYSEMPFLRFYKSRKIISPFSGILQRGEHLRDIQINAISAIIVCFFLVSPTMGISSRISHVRITARKTP